MGAEHRQINQEKCIQCGTCFEGCPVEAIEEA
jgi:formate hydrogenlyase subunit 6/NADH:ubiquinone oxidoreductase subunit I